MTLTNLREQSSLMARLLHILDCLFATAFFAALTIWYQVPWSESYTRLSMIIFVLCLISFQSFQLYRSWRGWKFYLEFLVIIRAWVVIVGLILFYFFIFKISHAYSRAVFMIWSLSTPVIIFIIHAAARKLLRFFRLRGKNMRRGVVVGAGELGRKLVREIEQMPWAGIDVVGFFDDKINDAKELEAAGRPVLGNIDKLADFLENNEIDYVYIALPMRAEKKIFGILRRCRSLGASIYLVPDLYVFGLHHAEMQSLGDMLILNFNPRTTCKRGFDLVFSALVLLLVSPLLVLIAAAIKLEDGGPVFYKHRRITIAGKEFGCLKFRTMRVGAEGELEQLLAENPELKQEWEKNFKLKNDPRITRLGRFLRKTSLDEFPQFFNVLKGDMSVVGARPIVGKELEEFYQDSAGRYCSMKPGITGPWQVGKRSDTEDYAERVKMDDWYILNHSMWHDIKIIAKTVAAVFRGKGAY